MNGELALMAQLADIRRQRGLTQTDVARRMGCGSKGFICDLESSRGNPYLSTLMRYADAIGVRIAVVVDPPTQGGAQ